MLCSIATDVTNFRNTILCNMTYEVTIYWNINKRGVNFFFVTWHAMLHFFVTYHAMLLFYVTWRAMLHFFVTAHAMLHLLVTWHNPEHFVKYHNIVQYSYERICGFVTSQKNVTWYSNNFFFFSTWRDMFKMHMNFPARLQFHMKLSNFKYIHKSIYICIYIDIYIDISINIYIKYIYVYIY